jgi:hypothetical protein
MPDPTPLFYPSIVVNLRLRFDEAFQIVDLPEPVPQGGSVDAVSGASGPVLRPLIIQQGKDNLSHILNRVPKTASVELPGYRTAGTFALGFDFRELPIDPRLLRAIGIEIYQGAVNPEDFATGMVQLEPDGTRRSILNVYDAAGNPRDDLMTLAGVVDTWRMTHDDKGSYIQMEGRDLRGIFLDSPLDLKIFDSIDMKMDIASVVAAILEKHPAGEQMTICTWPGEWVGGQLPSPADKEGLTRPRRKADGEGASVGSSDSGVNYWDMITKLCLLIGAIPFFKGRNLHIRKARSIFSQREGKDLSRSPFRSPNSQLPVHRLDDLGDEVSVRRMVYGRNIQSLTYERKFTGTKVPVIEVTSHNQSGSERGPGKLLQVQWPPKDKKLARLSGVSPSGEVAQTDILKINKPGIRDEKRLLEIARDLYEEIGRQEIGGAANTKSLSSLYGDNSDPDLLRLQPGDGVEFLVDVQTLNSRSPISAQFTDANRQSFAERVEAIKQDMLRKSGTVDENLVRVIVATSQSNILDIEQFFRVANVKYSWQEGIVQVAFDFQNYVVVRSEETSDLSDDAELDNRGIKQCLVVRKRIKASLPRPTKKRKPRRGRITVSDEEPTFVQGAGTLGVEIIGKGPLF